MKSLIQRIGKPGKLDDADMFWFNLLVGRLWASVCDKDFMMEYVEDKLKHKLDRMQKPKFMGDLHIKDMNVGDAVPTFTKVRQVKHD